MDYYRWPTCAGLMVFAALGFLGSTGRYAALSAQATQADDSATGRSVNVEWHLTKEEAVDLKRKYRVEEPSQFETRNPVVIGVIVLVGSFLVPQIVEAFADLFVKYKSDGFLVDARGERLVVEKSVRVPPGYVIVVGKEGIETVKVGGPNPNVKVLKDVLDWAVRR